MIRYRTLLLASLGFACAPLDVAEQEATPVLTPGITVGPEILPNPPNPEALFPEWARRSSIAGGAESYDFERCENIDPQTLVGRTRVRFGEIGPIGQVLARSAAGGTCTTADCYLKVSTAGLGREISLGASPRVDCEDPTTQTLGSCDLSSASALAGDPYRGNIIVADRIRVDGVLSTGELNLVLIAKESIEFTAAGRIMAFSAPAAKPAAIAGASGTANVCTVKCAHRDPLSEADPNCAVTCLPHFTSYGTGRPGAGGKSAGTVVLIAPTVILPRTPSGAQPHVTLEGQGGAAGGDVLPIRCDGTNSICIDHAVANAGAGGRGGNGGAGGKLITIADRFSGEPLRLSLSGGRAGARGSVPVLQLMTGSVVSSQRVVGSSGTLGAAGAAGFRDDLPIAGRYYDYAYLLSARGADRLIANARHYARYVHPTAEPGYTNSRIARGQFERLIDSYCRSIAPMAVGLPLSPRPTTRSGSAPLSYLPTTPSQARVDLCRESEVRLARVSQGMNWFGLTPDFYMYLRPDVMAGYRSAGRTLVDSVRASFEGVASLGGQQLLDIQAMEERALGEKRKHAEIAKAKLEQVGVALGVSLARVDRNQDELESSEAALRDAQARLVVAVVATECDIWCTVGRYLTVIENVANLVLGIGHSLTAIKDFLSTAGTLFDVDRIKGELAQAQSISLPTQGFDKLIFFGNYLSEVYQGRPGAEPLVGVGAVVTQVKAAMAQWTAADEAVNALSSPAAQWHHLAFNAAQSRSELRASLREVLVDLDQAKAIANTAIADKAGAIDALQEMQQLIELRIEILNDNLRAIEDHLIAAGELPIAQAEYTLALLEVKNLEAAIHASKCRLGLPDGSCAGLTAVSGPADTIRARRDGLCLAGRSMNDSVLLFDFYYQRSKDFVLLDQTPRPGDQSHDFRRILLRASDAAAFSQPSADPLVDDFLGQITATQNAGTVRGLLCLPGRDCGLGVMALDRDYQGEVMRELVASGRSSFDVMAECRPGAPNSHCNAGLVGSETPRQRVVGFDAELVMASGYRLGCSGASCASPTAGPADAPVDPGFAYRLRYRHSDAASFLWDDLTLRSFLFPESYPRQACEAARSLSGQDVDCRRVLDFGGSTEYAAPSQHTLAAPRPRTALAYATPDLYGTSVRGDWILDLTTTLADLNGIGGDACYGFDATHPLPLSCYPESCRSSCFDDLGVRRPAIDPDAPAHCSCYGANNALLPAASLAGRAECSGLSPTLSVLREASELPAACRPYVGTVAAPTQMEGQCRRFVTAGRLFPSGPLDCCNPDGRMKGNLNASVAASCVARGFDSDSACLAPDACLEICGPRCKAFKRALIGVEYRIDWLTEN